MEKISLNIVGLTYSQSQSGAYALMLSEEEGRRRLPIIIGANEAQSIAIELEKMKPNRPLTHDLFKSFCEQFDIIIQEVIIYNLSEGIFYAKMVCSKKGESKVWEIDARTSDAIAIAVRSNCPIYTYEFILKTAGIYLDEEKGEKSSKAKAKGKEQVQVTGSSKKSINQLQEELDKALKKEDYEKASKLRDEINKLKEGNNH